MKAHAATKPTHPDSTLAWSMGYAPLLTDGCSRGTGCCNDIS
jgi:hypothetical protein